MMNLYGRVFTPLQTAHVHVLAYPYECSALSVLDAIATGAALALRHSIYLNFRILCNVSVPRKVVRVHGNSSVH